MHTIQPLLDVLSEPTVVVALITFVLAPTVTGFLSWSSARRNGVGQDVLAAKVSKMEQQLNEAHTTTEVKVDDLAKSLQTNHGSTGPGDAIDRTYEMLMQTNQMLRFHLDDAQRSNLRQDRMEQKLDDHLKTCQGCTIRMGRNDGTGQ